MNILVVKPQGNGVYKDDTTMFCEGLKALGHNIIEMDAYYSDDNIYNKTTISDDTLASVDIAWAPYEPLIPIIIFLKSKYPNIRTVGHFELIPPMRINVESINEFFITNTKLPEDNPMVNMYNDYKLYIECWLQCDLKTYISDSMITEMERLLGRRIDRQRMEIKPYPLDIEMLERYRDDSIETKNQIVCSVRQVPHKKIHHIIRALSMITNPPKLVLIGEGTMTKALEEFAKNINVDVEFKGLSTDEVKCKTIQESMFAVYPWAWLPVTEAAYFRKPSIVYYFPESYTRIGDCAYYVENNNIPELARAIEIFTRDELTRTTMGDKAYKILMGDKIPTLRLDKACKIMENIFLEALK